jgi:hypothetical protein
MPHSNFDPQLEITKDGAAIRVKGPLEADDDDAKVIVSAYVTQHPAVRHDPPVEQQGPTAAGWWEVEHAGISLDADSWWFEAEVKGGPFEPGWAFANAEQLEVKEDGGTEVYTWSQWVWLHHP